MSEPTAAPNVAAFYVPTLTLATDDEVWLDLRRTNDGRTALFGYSTLDRLVRHCGPDRPWALLTVRQLQDAYEQAPYDLFFVDQPAP